MTLARPAGPRRKWLGSSSFGVDRASTKWALMRRSQGPMVLGSTRHGSRASIAGRASAAASARGAEPTHRARARSDRCDRRWRRVADHREPKQAPERGWYPGDRLYQVRRLARLAARA